VRRNLAVLQDTHDDGATTVCSSMLCQIVAARELLATFVAFEWLVLSMEGAVVTLEVLLAAEAARAELADEGLGWVFCQGLLATSSVDIASASDVSLTFHDRPLIV